MSLGGKIAIFAKNSKIETIVVIENTIAMRHSKIDGTLF